MTEQTDSLSSIIRAFKEFLYPPQPASWGQAPGLMDKFSALAAKTPETSELFRLKNEMALLVFVLGEFSRDEAILKACHRTLAGLGPFGRTLCLRFTANNLAPVNVLKAFFNSLPGRTQLHLADMFYKSGGERPDFFMEWAEEAVTAVQRKNPLEGLYFLHELGREGQNPSQCLKYGLMMGPFGEFLKKILSMRIKEKDLVVLNRAVLALNDPDITEALARHLGNPSPPVLAEVLDVLGRTGRKGDLALIRAVAKRIQHPDARVKLAAVSALADLKAPNMGKVFSYLVGKEKDLIAPLGILAARLNRAGLADVFQSISGESGEELRLNLLYALAAHNPRETGRLAKAVSDDEKPLKDIQAFVKKVEKEYADRAFPEPDLPLPVQELESSEGRGKAKGVLGRLLKKNRKSKAEIKSGTAISGEDLSESDLTAISVENLALEKVSLRLSKFAQAEFESSSFSGTDLSGAKLGKSVFRNCGFIQARFAGADLSEVKFVDCSFTDCDFSGARLSGCEFSACRCVKTDFYRCGIRDSKISGCLVKESRFCGARIGVSDIRSTRIEVSDLSWARVSGSRLLGLEIAECFAREAVFRDCAVVGSTLTACWLTGSEAVGLDADEPNLLGLQFNYNRRHLTGLALSDPDSRGTAAKIRPHSMRLVEYLALERAARMDTGYRELLFLRNNRRRLDMAQGKMSPGKRGFFKLAPYLLHSAIFEQAEMGGRNIPATYVWRYYPDYTTLKLAAEHFPEVRAPALKALIKIEALYIMGSSGTVAQDPSSDLDYWICCDLSCLSEREIQDLKMKLSAVTRWASERFGVEAVFFLMDLEQIRLNMFGFSDEESSGSAQAMLLKEEFYRTGILIAGKEPAWWVLPPGIGEDEYGRRVEALARRQDVGESRILDMGYVRRIPPDEFFGASLWQIVKGLKSPFKSVLKFGLLERYMAGAGKGHNLLCERIKENLFMGRTAPWEIDPYALLFREVSDFYRSTGDEKAVKLVRTAFLLKSRIDEKQDPESQDHEWDEDLARPFFVYASPDKGDILSKWGFNRLVRMGSLLNDYMIGTYKKISRGASKDPAAAKISPEDMTKLGRRIFSTLGRKQDKVERLPLLIGGRKLFSEYHLSFDKQGTKPAVWRLLGKPQRVDGKSGPMAEVRSGHDPVPIMAWMIANELYAPHLPVHLAKAAGPVSLADVTDLLRSLFEFFPPDKAFDTPMEEMLNPEAAVRLFFVVNFLTMRELPDITEAHIIYTTNWGEMFCRRVKVEGPEIQNQPHKFAAGVLPHEIGGDLEMSYYMPPRSKAPKLLII